MQPSSIAQQMPQDESDDDLDDLAPSQAPLRPTLSQQQPSSRPGMVRSPPGRLSEISPGASEGNDDAGQRTARADVSGGQRTLSDSGSIGAKVQNAGSRAEEERLAKLKEAVNSKLLLQQRKRGSYGSTSSAMKRISPIREEDGASMSPSMMAAFATPPDAGSRPLSTVSTESTESGRTVRASVPPTPAEGRPLRTPSYPFPYVPGTPRTWSSSFHQPFTALSPTTTVQPTGEHDTPAGRRSMSLVSGGSTPAASTAADAMYPNTNVQGSDDPRFPTPSLYDMVLQLNTEPGMEQWWATVTNVMHDWFKAERVTLVMPLDPTDLENVPWGQKATFSMNGREEFVPHGTVMEQTSHSTRPDIIFREASNDNAMDFQMQKLHPERLRPRLESRHSYAGHGRDTQTITSNAPLKTEVRPIGPQRTVTHASGLPSVTGATASPGPPRQLPQRFSSSSTVPRTSVIDPEFSSVAGGIDAGPYAEVFPSLRALDHEVSPLIEATGVNRVLERGRLVMVTRDYVSESSGSVAGSGSGGKGGADSTAETTPKDAPIPATFGNYRSVFAADNAPEARRGYEEYEQTPASPWAQSPAPSPAIQSDEEDNPFFPSEEQQVEASFGPAASGTPKDYSQFGPVEAIGVDRASTVIHIPLVHPTLSQPMQSLRMKTSQAHPGVPQRSNTVDFERRAPIAILSVLGAAVPYPQNLTHSLKLLGPHLATSFATAQQFSSTRQQTVSIRHRRTASGHYFHDAPMTIEPASLEDIVNAELEEPPGSISGSVTSPSDYSGRSRHSPTSSLIGTPGWDPATHGWTSKSAATTPAMTGSEMVDNYFEAKKQRSSHRSGSNASASTSNTPARMSKQSGSQDGKSGSLKSSPGEGELRTPRSEQKVKVQKSLKEERSPMHRLATYERSPTRAPDAASSLRSAALSPQDDAARAHSLLHSYGADFETSFGLQPGASATEEAKTGPHGHARKSSYSEDMPPPSERLLRTIIDSVPVQIFTAKPDTGQLSWVNTKFLIYRGQEARQVLASPWQAIHPEDRTDFMASWHRSLRTAQQLQQKVRLARFDGSFRWFYVRAAPLKDKRQRIVHWIGTMMDFHEQHLAESNAARQQETAASEAKYRALANSSPQIVFAVDKTKGVTFCNSQWIHYSGQTESQALGVGFMDHVHPEDLIKCRLPSFDDADSTAPPTNVPTSLPAEIKRSKSASAASSSGSSETEKGVYSSDSSPIVQMPQRKLSELATTGILKVARDADGRPSYSTEVRLKSKEGEFRWHLVRVLLAEPLVRGVNEEETWYGTCTDINDHKTLERDLKETMDEKSRFLSNMSHEIRTPLNGITGMVNFLIDSSLSAEQMEHVNIIRASTEGLRGLINDILDLSKAEAGMIQLSMDWLYVRALIEEVNDLTSAMAIDKGLELNYIVDEDVPAQVKGDRFRLRQILLNVIGNAIKFTQKGEVFVRCSVVKKTDEPLAGNEMFIRFEIVDTGSGFNDKEAEVLFKRFSQIDGSSTRQHGGTGLGLVISRQLAQLHGGDMSAKGVPGKGSTFAFYVKTELPSRYDQPPQPPPTPGVSPIPIMPMSPGIGSTPTPMSRLTKTASVPLPVELQAKPSPKFLTDTTSSPSPFTTPDVDSPSASSASSEPSVRSRHTSSLRSERSSASSYVPESAFANTSMNLAMPPDPKSTRGDTSSLDSSQTSNQSNETIKGLSSPPAQVTLTSPGGTHIPPMFSVLVICPLKYSREATVQHIDKTLPNNVPHQITSRASLVECQEMLGGDDPVRFTHIVVVLQDVDEIIALLDQALTLPTHPTPSIVVITDLAQRRKIMEQAPKYDYDRLNDERRLRFIFKPLKPSRFAFIFDPQKEREMSTDRNQDSAQQVAVNQKQVFEELAKRLGNKDKRVLLVEDNRVNQMVILKFLAKVSIKAETVLDGVQCTDKVFAQPPDYYSIILCDLHMPNKDGYQTCKEIRKWEKKNKFPLPLPIIALSANVLGDVYQKCVDAGFNSYMTKPVDFKELSQVLMTFMDPADPKKPHELMKMKKGGGAVALSR